MENRVLYVGLDVDDKAYHGTVFNPESGEYESFAVSPTISKLKSKLKSYLKNHTQLKCCYEATYIGFSLHRELNKVKDISCEVIAPSLIPQIPGKAVKTDRIDSINLATFYAKGMLTAIYVPKKEEENIRDLLRSRVFIKDKLKETRRHLLSLCRRNNLNYRQDVNLKNASHWTGLHMTWLKSKAKNSKDKFFKTNLDFLLNTIEQLEDVILNYDQEIENICQSKSYKKKVEVITCFRGIGYQSAITLVLEIGDIRRFEHPSKLVSYAGLDIRERSSGGKEKKIGISRLGNKYIRTTLVESCQRAHLIPTIGKPLKKRREMCTVSSIKIADRCMKRLHKKGSKLLYRGKPVNKIKVACAREMIGFVWESLSQAA